MQERSQEWGRGGHDPSALNGFQNQKKGLSFVRKLHQTTSPVSPPPHTKKINV